MELEPLADLGRLQRIHGWGFEDVKMVVEVMAETGAEPVYSMGDDIPIAPLGRTPRRLYGYLRQRFAQVTNPAIDPLREKGVMSLRTLLGARSRTLEPEGGAESELSRRHHPAVPQHSRLLELESPVLGAGELARVLEEATVLDATGLGAEVMRTCFPSMPSRIGGADLADLDAQARARMAEATALPDHGRVRFRKAGEHHAYNPLGVRTAQKAAAGADRDLFHEWLRTSHMDRPQSLRELLVLCASDSPAPLDEVEPASEIVKRFVSTAMSLGALSPEAHEALALAMNQIGARSNSGEGGEDPGTYDDAAVRRDNRVKQVASARFGVTPAYLKRADELQIKIAQGSKPGEGRQLPGLKVTSLIARLRHAQPGMALISPPPHHDIYSIEDLAQLIHDLKTVNPRARVGLKLVAEAGVGTIAAGVAKARAGYIP